MADTAAEGSGAAAGAEAAEGADEGAEGAGGAAADADAAEGGDAAGKKDEAGDGKVEDTEADDGKEPESRKKPIDFILARKDAKIAKLAGKGAADKSGAGGDGEGKEEEEDDAVAPEDAEVVIKTVMPIIKPLLEQNAAQENEKELGAFLTANPDFKPFEAKIRRFMTHPDRAGIPIKAIAYEVAGDKLMQIGAKRSKAADDKARATQTGGGSGREGGGEKSVWDMTPEEFAAAQQKVRSSPR